MDRKTFGSRKGFTLVELLVVIAIIAVLIGLLLPAIQRARDASYRTKCQNNMKQVALAFFTFNDTWGTFPPYNNDMNSDNGASQNQVYGSWIVFLMPYLDQESLWGNIYSDVQNYTNTGYPVSFPGGTLITAGYWTVPPVPATYNNWSNQNPPPQYQCSGSTTTTTTGNGYTISSSNPNCQWVPPPTPDPGTGTSGSGWVPPVYGPPGPPVNGNVGVYSPTNRAIVQKVLVCPSDPSLGRDQQSNLLSQVYLFNGVWAGTNYLANWNAITNGDPVAGYSAAANRLSGIPDGYTNTILLGEAYAWCDGIGRTASLAWSTNNSILWVPGTHNFGLTFSIPQGTINGVSVTGPNGVPNPTPSINFMFQIQPAPLPNYACPAGRTCCNNLTVQSGHNNALNIALCDGSVRSVTGSLSSTTWLYAMLPNDGNALGSDW